MSAPTIPTVLQQAFSAIFVLTIHRNQSRHQNLQQALKDLDYTLFYGTDKETLSMAKLIKEGVFSPERAATYLKRPLSIGEVACALTHKHAYETILEHTFSSVLILEDDVDFSKELPSAEVLQQALSELPEDWELCYLGYERNQRPKSLNDACKEILYLTLKRLGLSSRLDRKIKNRHVRPFSTYLNRAGVHTGTHAYALSVAGCRKLYEKQVPLCMCSDHLLNEMIAVEGLKAYVLKQKIFINKSVEGQESCSL